MLPCRAIIIEDQKLLYRYHGVLAKAGYPIAVEAGHGAGARSIVVFAAEYNADLLYQVEGDIFNVRSLV